MLRISLAASLCFFLSGLTAAVHAEDAAQAETLTPQEFLATLTPQSGKIALAGGIATLDLPDTFRYLSAKDAERVLFEGWGNVPDAETLGMIVPTGVSPLSQDGWGVLLTYNRDGHVNDDDAAGINYDDLLKTIRQFSQEKNAARIAHGYPAVMLLGWAEPPGYDKNTHKLYWATRLHASGEREDSLNYNVRVLGRDGVLVLNAVANIDKLDAIKRQMQQVALLANFTPGHAYADFDVKRDKVADYGITALVAGGVAAKLGLFSKLFALLLGFKKIFVLVLFAGLALVARGLGLRDRGNKVNLEK